MNSIVLGLGGGGRGKKEGKVRTWDEFQSFYIYIHYISRMYIIL